MFWSWLNSWGEGWVRLLCAGDCDPGRHVGIHHQHAPLHAGALGVRGPHHRRLQRLLCGSGGSLGPCSLALLVVIVRLWCVVCVGRGGYRDSALPLVSVPLFTDQARARNSNHNNLQRLFTIFINTNTKQHQRRPIIPQQQGATRHKQTVSQTTIPRDSSHEEQPRQRQRQSSSTNCVSTASLPRNTRCGFGLSHLVPLRASNFLDLNRP